MRIEDALSRGFRANVCLREAIKAMRCSLSGVGTDGAPSRSRTYDLSLRRGALYPAELSGRFINQVDTALLITHL